MRDKDLIEGKTQRIIEMTAGFCDAHLDEEYKQLCEKLVRKMSGKRNVPFLSGRMESWAAAIIYALGSINFLFDKSFDPYASGQDISDYFRTSKSTVSQKAKLIRDMFKMGYWDKEFSTNKMREDNPLSDMVMLNGLIVSKQALPQEIRREIIEEREGS